VTAAVLDAGEPMVLLLDDLHWADAASLRLLDFLSRRLAAAPVLVVAASRAPEPVADAAAVPLAGLSPAEVGELLAGVLGAPAPPDAVAHIVRRTAGNPFFVRQLALLWPDVETVPPGVVAVLSRRRTNDLPNRFRVPHGPGWALVGDAGLVMDPITGQGIADAFRDAELLADAVATGIAGGRLERALARYRRRRDRAALPMYRLTQHLARLAPARAADRQLFSALAARPAEIERFFGVLTGVHPPAALFSPPHLIRLLGPRRFLRVAREMAAR
jgi:hypothetical protein